MAWLRVFNERGKYQDDSALMDVLNYCTRADKSNSDLIGGWAVNPENAREEMETLTKLINKDTGCRLRHFEISFSPERHIEPEIVAQISKECSKYYGHDHQILYAVHTDKEHSHAHFVMNTVRYTDGKKYRGTKQDLYRFEKHCTNVLHKFNLKESVNFVHGDK